jgi:DNA-binding response OmpR family regulator
MHKTILLVSRDRNLQATRASILEQAGYRTMRSPAEQDQFIDVVHEANPSVFVLCLRYGLAQPSTLLRHVEDCFAAQPGGSRLCVIEKSNVVAWPKKAS